MKRLALALVGLLFALCARAQGEEGGAKAACTGGPSDRCASRLADPETFVSLGAGVLKIEVVKRGGSYSLGSGVVVGKGVVVTNCHVTREAEEIRVLEGGARWRAQAQSADVERDLCLLRVPGVARNAVQLGSAAQLKIGQRLAAIGYTGGLGLSNSQGRVVALHRYAGSRVIQTDNWFNSGASGGGLFDDRMQLVGILTFRLRGGRAHYFAAPVDWVHERIGDEARYRKVAPLDPKALPYWQRPGDEQPNFLQAAVLERSGDWRSLDDLAERWLKDDAGDFEPWYLHGVAAFEQQRYAAARDALRRAVALEPAAADAWFRIGAASHQLGERELAQQALARLGALDPALAERLEKMLGIQ